MKPVRRPDLDEALESIGERVEYAIRLATEAHMTDDCTEDDEGKIDPIHAYADGVIKDTIPMAVLGLFLLAYRPRPNNGAEQ
jgi:hypothetical protein